MTNRNKICTINHIWLIRVAYRFTIWSHHKINAKFGHQLIYYRRVEKSPIYSPIRNPYFRNTEFFFIQIYFIFKSNTHKAPTNDHQNTCNVYSFLVMICFAIIAREFKVISNSIPNTNLNLLLILLLLLFLLSVIEQE